MPYLKELENCLEQFHIHGALSSESMQLIMNYHGLKAMIGEGEGIYILAGLGVGVEVLAIIP